MNRLNSAISIIVPTLNEADNLPNLFKRINKSLSKSCIPYEIIVVDDRSSDDTVEIAKSYANKYNVRTEIKIGQRGKAFSLIQGFKGAKNSLVCMIDADLQYPPEAIAHMYKLLKSNDGDIVITERFEPQTSRLRQVSSKTFNFVFAKMLFGINYDTQSGLKLFKKEILDKISLNPSPWSFDLEFLVKSIENKYTILNYKIPFNRREYGEPKVHVISTSIELAKASVRLWRETPRKEIKNNYKQNLKVFRGMSVFMVTMFLSTAIISLGGNQVQAASVTGLTSTVKQDVSSVESKIAPLIPTIKLIPYTTSAPNQIAQSSDGTTSATPNSTTESSSVASNSSSTPGSSSSNKSTTASSSMLSKTSTPNSTTTSTSSLSSQNTIISSSSVANPANSATFTTQQQSVNAYKPIKDISYKLAIFLTIIGSVILASIGTRALVYKIVNAHSHTQFTVRR